MFTRTQLTEVLGSPEATKKKFDEDVRISRLILEALHLTLERCH